MNQHEMMRDAKATLTIVLRKDGQVGVMGPLGEKMMCYGMLEIARDMVQAFKEPSAVITPKIIPPTDLRSTN